MFFLHTWEQWRAFARLLLLRHHRWRGLSSCKSKRNHLSINYFFRIPKMISSINQSISRSIDPSINQSINQSNEYSISQSNEQTINQSINQPKDNGFTLPGCFSSTNVKLHHLLGALLRHATQAAGVDHGNAHFRGFSRDFSTPRLQIRGIAAARLLLGRFRVRRLRSSSAVSTGPTQPRQIGHRGADTGKERPDRQQSRGPLAKLAFGDLLSAQRALTHLKLHLSLVVADEIRVILVAYLKFDGPMLQYKTMQRTPQHWTTVTKNSNWRKKKEERRDSEDIQNPHIRGGGNPNSKEIFHKQENQDEMSSRERVYFDWMKNWE